MSLRDHSVQLLRMTAPSVITFLRHLRQLDCGDDTAKAAATGIAGRVAGFLYGL